MKKMMEHINVSPTTTNIPIIQNSLIKGVRYVLLGLCILALVLQPVKVFALPSVTNTYTYNNFESFKNACIESMTNLYSFIVGTMNSSIVTSISQCISDAGYDNDFSPNDFIAIQYYDNGNKIIAVPYTQFNFVVSNSTGGSNETKQLSLYVVNTFSQTSKAVVIYDLEDPSEAYLDDMAFNLNANYILYNSTQYSGFTLHCPQVDNVYFNAQDTPTINSDVTKYLYNSSYNPNPLDPDPNNPSDINGVDYPLNIYYQLGLMFSQNFNSYTPDGSIHFNSSWVGVGQALTYDYLCKTNKNSETVSITLADGSTVSLQNYLYGEVDYTSDLSTIKTTLSTISSRVNTTNTRLNTLNTHLTNKLDPITDDINQFTDKFNELYPNDAVELTSTIEEQIYDTDNGGLGLGDMQSTLSIKDGASDAFDVDVSLSQGISGMFDFLDTEEWGFWSNACKNDMDTTTQNRLMSEDVDDSLLQDKMRDFYNRLGMTYDGE